MNCIKNVFKMSICKFQNIFGMKIGQDIGNVLLELELPVKIKLKIFLVLK